LVYILRLTVSRRFAPRKETGYGRNPSATSACADAWRTFDDESPEVLIALFAIAMLRTPEPTTTLIDESGYSVKTKECTHRFD
jgi:hypothetical protein